jgi:hypothetical protein
MDPLPLHHGPGILPLPKLHHSRMKIRLEHNLKDRESQLRGQKFKPKNNCNLNVNVAEVNMNKATRPTTNTARKNTKHSNAKLA